MILSGLGDVFRGVVDKQIANALARSRTSTAPMTRKAAVIVTDTPVADRLTTPVQLDALPISTVVLAGATVYQHWSPGGWYAIADRRNYTSAQVLFGAIDPGPGWARILS